MGYQPTRADPNAIPPDRTDTTNPVNRLRDSLVRCEWCGQVYHKSELSCPHCLAPLSDDALQEAPRKEIPYDPPSYETKLPRNPYEIKELVDDGFIPLKWAKDIVVYEDVDTNVICADDKIYHTLPTRYTFGDWLDEQEQRLEETNDQLDELGERVAAPDDCSDEMECEDEYEAEYDDFAGYVGMTEEECQRWVNAKQEGMPLTKGEAGLMVMLAIWLVALALSGYYVMIGEACTASLLMAFDTVIAFVIRWYVG